MTTLGKNALDKGKHRFKGPEVVTKGHDLAVKIALKVRLQYRRKYLQQKAHCWPRI